MVVPHLATEQSYALDANSVASLGGTPAFAFDAALDRDGQLACPADSARPSPFARRPCSARIRRTDRGWRAPTAGTRLEFGENEVSHAGGRESCLRAGRSMRLEFSDDDAGQ